MENQRATTKTMREKFSICGTNCSFSLQFLQNLGKVDRTADDIFDEHLQNFMRQQNAANRLQKEFNNYIRCVRGKSIEDNSN